MVRTFSLIALLASASLFVAPAMADDEELVRLPGQGEFRDPLKRDKTKGDRLKPGAGLLVSFDTDENGRISTTEISAGIPVAFKAADGNEDGYLTAIEQQEWAANLPTRDDSLANPFRFDPNLDKRVYLEEFTKVITDLGVDYADEASGEIIITELKAYEPKRKRTLNPFDRENVSSRNGQRRRN